MANQRKNSNRKGGNRQNGNGSSSQKGKQYDAILKFKAATLGSDTVKHKIKDDDDNEVTEHIRSFKNGDPKENLIRTFDQLNTLVNTYGLDTEKMKSVHQLTTRALSGKARDAYITAVGTYTSWRSANVLTNYKKFQRKTVMKVCGEDCLEKQEEYLENAPFNRDFTDLEENVERAFEINRQSSYMSTAGTIMSDKELDKRCISKRLSTGVRKQYIQSGGDILSAEDGILEHVRKASRVSKKLRDVETDARNYRNDQDDRKDRSQGGDKGSDRGNQRNQSNDDSVNPNIKNPCRKHDGKHDWSNCPDNPNRKERGNRSNNNSNNQNGKDTQSKGDLRATTSISDDDSLDESAGVTFGDKVEYLGAEDDWSDIRY